MLSVTRDHVRLYYTDAGDGPPLLFHTGGAGDGRMWQMAGYTQVLRPARQVVMDHRGHGKSDCPAELASHRIEEYAADVIAVLRRGRGRASHHVHPAGLTALPTVRLRLTRPRLVTAAFAVLVVAVAVGLGAPAALASNVGWSAPVFVDGSPAGLGSISCASASFCVAFDLRGNAVTWNGSSWSAPVAVDSAYGLDYVSCVSSSFCAAVDVRTVQNNQTSSWALFWNGSSWTAPAEIDAPGTVTSVSCVSSSFCVAVGGESTLTWNGTSWSAPSEIDDGSSLNAVSCTSMSFCVAVDESGDALTWNGAAWSQPRQIYDANSPGLGAVSCVSASFCVATTEFAGDVLMWNGSVWSAPTTIDSNGQTTGVSCVSASFCIAVDDAGNALTWSGSSWSAPLDIDGTSALEGISCASASFCAADDENGNALTYGSGTSPPSGSSGAGGSGASPTGGSSGASGAPSPASGAPECDDLASIGFGAAEKQLVPIPSVTSDDGDVALSASISLGSVGICSSALAAPVQPYLDVGLPGLELTASYETPASLVSPTFKYSFLPLGWFTAAGVAIGLTPSIEWSQAITFGGSAQPSLSFAFKPGQPLEPSIDLVTVPISHVSVLLPLPFAVGSPYLQASVGPELSLSLGYSTEDMAREEDEDVASGEDTEAASEEIADEVGADVESASEYEQVALDPEDPALQPDEATVSTTVADDAQATLPEDAADGGLDSDVTDDSVAADDAADAAVDGAADFSIGDLVVDVGEACLVLCLGRDEHSPAALAPGLRVTRGASLAQHTLEAVPIRRLSPHALHRGGFPRGSVATLARDVLDIPVAAEVRPLAVTSTQLRAGRTVSVVATRLSGPHQRYVLLILQGPGYRATRLLRVSNHAAGATITLPRTLSSGTWILAIEDLSKVRTGSASKLGGYASLGLARYIVRAHKSTHR